MKTKKDRKRKRTAAVVCTDLFGAWVRWKDRKPPIGKDVLMYMSNAEMIKIDCRRTIHRYDGALWSFERSERFGNGEVPSHWMTLPPPPNNVSTTPVR